MKRLLALSVLLMSSAASAAPYNLQILNSLSGSGDSRAEALNDNGMVVGQSYNAVSGNLESVYWDGGGAQSLGVGGTARAVNNSGTVVGETGVIDGFPSDSYAYSYTVSGGISYLGTLGGPGSTAYDINDSGTIVGYSFPTGGNLLQSLAFIYESGVMTSLGTVSNPMGYSRAHSINEAGEIVGRASLDLFSNSEKNLAYWDPAGTLNYYDAVTGNYSTALQINNNGLIAGNGRTASTGNNQIAMVWDNTGALLSVLGTLGGAGSKASALNDDGTIVGYADDANGDRRAMISYDGTSIVDLNTLVDLTGTGFVSLDEALDINASGQIVGYGTLADGSRGAFIVSAVPVPAAVWLFGSALAGLGFIRRKNSAA